MTVQTELTERFLGTRFRSAEFLSDDGHCVCFKAEDPDGRDVLVRLIPKSDPETGAHIIDALRQLPAHKNIAPCQADVFQTMLYFVRDLGENTSTLAQIIKADRGLEPVRATRLFVQIIDAVIFANRHNLSCRGFLSPSSIWVSGNGDEELARVVDLGFHNYAIALPKDDGVIAGILFYMSPEHVMCSQTDSRSDIYAMGLIMYETLAGEHPAGATEALDVMRWQVRDEVKRFSEVKPNLRIPKALEKVIYKAMEKVPNKRFSTMEQLREALVRAAGLKR